MKWQSSNCKLNYRFCFFTILLIKTTIHKHLFHIYAVDRNTCRVFLKAANVTDYLQRSKAVRLHFTVHRFKLCMDEIRTWKKKTLAGTVTLLCFNGSVNVGNKCSKNPNVVKTTSGKYASVHLANTGTEKKILNCRKWRHVCSIHFRSAQQLVWKCRLLALVHNDTPVYFMHPAKTFTVFSQDVKQSKIIPHSGLK